MFVRPVCEQPAGFGGNLLRLPERWDPSEALFDSSRPL